MCVFVLCADYDIIIHFTINVGYDITKSLYCIKVTVEVHEM